MSNGPSQLISSRQPQISPGSDTLASRLLGFAGRQLSSVLKTENVGSAANVYDSTTPQLPFNILKDYPWTGSSLKEQLTDIPYAILTEHRNTENTIMRMVRFYGQNVLESVATTTDDIGAAASAFVSGVTPQGQKSQGLLTTYDDIFPDSPTNNQYVFPYFSKTFVELQTDPWNSLDGAGEAVGESSSGVQTILRGLGKTNSADQLGLVGSIGGAAMALGKTALKAMYPLVGITDRPKIFASHSERTLSIEFPLYNTLNEGDWIKNSNFIHIFMTQNLYNKRDFITGIPPVYYRVLVPGQYFCFASYVESFQVENLGNVRMMYPSEGEKPGFISGQGEAVPDAYQVKIVLKELVMPSLNQYQSLVTGDAFKRVQVSKSA